MTTDREPAKTTHSAVYAGEDMMIVYVKQLINKRSTAGPAMNPIMKHE